ncbi:MAG TPA: hypothetical protein VGN80_03705, partial [Devosiaceae bacterium]|nr:hypothetical protein [Devosiaceae bacterium]
VHRPRDARRSCRSCTTAGPDGAMLVVGPEHWLPARRCAASGMTAVGGESSEGERPTLLSAVITRPPGLAGVEVRRV